MYCSKHRKFHIFIYLYFNVFNGIKPRHVNMYPRTVYDCFNNMRTWIDELIENSCDNNVKLEVIIIVVSIISKESRKIKLVQYHVKTILHNGNHMIYRAPLDWYKWTVVSFCNVTVYNPVTVILSYIYNNKVFSHFDSSVKLLDNSV